MSAPHIATPAQSAGASPSFKLLQGGHSWATETSPSAASTGSGSRRAPAAGPLEGSLAADSPALGGPPASSPGAGSPGAGSPAHIGDFALAAAEREARAVARGIAQAAIEVLAGTRPAQQLSRWLSPRCFSALQHRATLTRAHILRNKAHGLRLHRNPQVRSVRAFAISQDICEASLVVAEELRSRAVAMRLERTNNVWRITALEIG